MLVILRRVENHFLIELESYVLTVILFFLLPVFGVSAFKEQAPLGFECVPNSMTSFSTRRLDWWGPIYYQVPPTRPRRARVCGSAALETPLIHLRWEGVPRYACEPLRVQDSRLSEPNHDCVFSFFFPYLSFLVVPPIFRYYLVGIQND